MLKKILNKTQSHRDRYTLIHEGMGGYGDPKHYPTHNWCVVNGVDRGNGYQGYYSITHFFTIEYAPNEAKENLKTALKSLGFSEYVKALPS